MSRYYAHSGIKELPDDSDWQLLRDHLLAVAEGAESRASMIEIRGRSLGPAGYAAGLSHDLGKYRAGFQSRLRGFPVPDRKTTYHKQAGSALAWDRKQRSAAFAIAGHHGGLPDKHGAQQGVSGDTGATAVTSIWDAAVADCPELASCSWPPILSDNALLFDLETRVLFSCLVDADWANTSEHDRRVKGWPEEPDPPGLTKELAKSWLKNVRDRIRTRAETCQSSEVARVRDDVLRASLSAAELAPGFFTMTVPTGGGKTLSALAFALKHVASTSQDLRRIIYVAPYLSIIDQNAVEIRKALGVAREGPEVFEHHSLSDPSPKSTEAHDQGDDRAEARLAAAARRAENWDAPIIVTTNVQFFESLFSNEPGRCRKLHNIARSVILLDESQAIPKDLLAATCGMLAQLVEHLGCTIVLVTATQPAFDHPELRAQGAGLPDVRPIIGPDLDLFRRLRRVRVEWPRPGEFLGWDDVAKIMTADPSNGRRAALCVVNTRRAARELYQEVQKLAPGDVFHLSTWMCPAHRLAVLARVKARLDPRGEEFGRPCYLISTQLIEAGVDVDFPLVLRELAPLEAIFQAAGRANREGILNGPDGSPGGRVIVFRSRAAEEHPRRYYPPDPWYIAGRDVLNNHFLNRGLQPSIDDPDTLRTYFDVLLNVGDLDPRGIKNLREQMNFPEVARKYRVIEDGGQPVVVASWADHTKKIDALLDALQTRPTRSRFRALAPFQVNLRFPTDRQLSFVVEGPCGLSVWRGGYEPELGLWEELLVEQTVL